MRDCATALITSDAPSLKASPDKRLSRFDAAAPLQAGCRNRVINHVTPNFRDGVFENTVSIRDADTLEPRFLEEAMAAVTVIGDTRHTGGSIRLNASWR